MSSKAGIWLKAALFLVAGAWQCGGPAAASPPPAGGEVRQITVHFDDLNLDQAAGVAVLYRRIRGAAEQVCGEPQRPGSRIISPFWAGCVAQAVERAVVALDRPSLTAYHRVHTAPHNQEVSLARR